MAADKQPDQEPSIEEILASIRQIISDDDDKEGAAEEPVVMAPPPHPPAPTPPPKAKEPEPVFEEPEEKEEDVLELTEQMAIADQRPFQTVEPSDDLEFAETEDMPEVVALPRESESPQPRAARNVEPPQDTVSRPLLSASTMTAVDSAFNSLAQRDGLTAELHHRPRHRGAEERPASIGQGCREYPHRHCRAHAEREPSRTAHAGTPTPRSCATVVTTPASSFDGAPNRARRATSAWAFAMAKE